jgi:hypothetical protein
MSATPNSRPYRVVQWTTGKTGSAAVRGIVRNRELELVGCFAYSPGKVGKDIGELCGIEPIGVFATDDVESLVALRPDCVAYMAYRPDFDHLERILESGINVVSTMYMLAGGGYGDEAQQRLASAMERGQSSLYVSGVYPGHAPMVGLAASAMCTRIDRISVLESLDIRGYQNEKMYRAMGFDLPPDDPEVYRAVEANCGSFREQIRVMAGALDVELDEVRFTAEAATANDDNDFGFMVIQKGRVGAFKGVLSGMVDGVSRIECQFVWKLGDNNTPDWPVEHGYVIEIRGEPDVRVRLEPIGEHFDGAVTTAMPCVNAIPAVVAAPPGIVNHMSLPFVRGHVFRTG